MAGMIEVAKATVTIIPTMQGAQQTITAELTGASATAGTTAGKTAGKNMVASMSDTMSKAGKSLTKSVTVPLAAVGVASVAAWKEVDNGLDTIVEKTGASGAALENMNDILENITASIPTNFATAGEAIGEVNTRFGVTDKELESLSSQFVKFAKLNNQDVSSSVDNVSKVIAAFGLETKDTSTILDALNKVGQQTGVDVGSLAQTMSMNAASFREMGLSAEEAASFLGAADMAGIESTQMVMGLRTAMKKAASDGQTLDETLAGFTSTMKSNAPETDKLATAYELFGSRAGAAIYNAVNNGKLDLDNFTGSLGDFVGSVDKTFNDTLDPMDNFTTVLNQLKSVGADLVVTVGPSLASVLGTVSNVVKGLADAWDRLSPGTQDFIVKTGLIAAAAGPVLSVGGKLLGGVQKLGAFIPSIGEKLSGLTSKMSSLGSSSSTAAGGVSTAATSFGTLAGQALMLVAAGAAVFLIAEAMSTLVNSAIKLAEAGPLAIGVFVGIAAVAVGVTAAIVAIGSASTASAVGLLALGAAVLMVSAGISIIILSLTAFASQLPTIATYGNTAASALVAMAGGLTLMAAGAIALEVALIALIAEFVLLTPALAAADIAMVALLAEFLLVDAELLVMAVAVEVVKSSMKDVAQSARSAANDLRYMVNAVDVVGRFLDGLKNIASSAMESVASLFNTKSQQIDTSAKTSINGIKSTISSGTSSIVTTWNSALTKLVLLTGTKMVTARTVLQKEISAIQDIVRNTNFTFNKNIALPHFKMAGSFSAESGSVPSVSVSWYREAASKGAIFRSPSIIGVGDASQPEMLIGERTLYQKISEATGKQSGDTIIPVYIGGDLLDTVVAKANKRNVYRSGGR